MESYYFNQKYKYFLNKKDFEKAQAAELASKENLQDRFELDSNLGVIFNLLNKNEESEKSFDQALNVIPQQFENELDRDQALFTTYFNRGVFFQGQKKIDLALKNYQAALDLNPTSVETKINIELLLKGQKDDQKKKEGKDGKGGQDGKDGQDKKPKDGEDQKKPGEEGKDQDKDKEKEKEKKESAGKDRKQNSKYQPRPFKGDQLSEGDVKKILGELSQQDKKIRAQFDKKEKNESGVERKNEKDW